MVPSGCRVAGWGRDPQCAAEVLKHRIDPRMQTGRLDRDRHGSGDRLLQIALTELSLGPDTDYDRIVATVSVRPVPQAWLDALRPGGRIVTTITDTSLLINAHKRPDGVVRGRVQPDPATFMRTRHETDYPARLDHVYDAARDQPGDATRQLTGPLPDLWDDWQLRCLYELATPDIENRSATREDGSQLTWLLATDGSWARADSETMTVHQSGPRRLWDDLERVQSRWTAADHFPLHTMTVELGPDRNTLTSPNGTWTLEL